MQIGGGVTLLLVSFWRRGGVRAEGEDAGELGAVLDSWVVGGRSCGSS